MDKSVAQTTNLDALNQGERGGQHFAAENQGIHQPATVGQKVEKAVGLEQAGSQGSLAGDVRGPKSG